MPRQVGSSFRRRNKKRHANHGEAANKYWNVSKQTNTKLNMQTTARLEGLHVEREIVLDSNNPVFAVKETVQNIYTLGRLCNMVQHPTLAAPFLDDQTIINCNAGSGFDQAHYKNAKENVLQWPVAK